MLRFKTRNAAGLKNTPLVLTNSAPVHVMLIRGKQQRMLGKQLQLKHTSQNSILS